MKKRSKLTEPSLPEITIVNNLAEGSFVDMDDLDVLLDASDKAFSEPLKSILIRHCNGNQHKAYKKNKRKNGGKK